MAELRPEFNTDVVHARHLEMLRAELGDEMVDSDIAELLGAGHGPLEGLACAGAPHATSLATVAAFRLFGAGHGPLEGRCRAGFFTSALENAVRLARQELANEQFDDVFTVTGR